MGAPASVGEPPKASWGRLLRAATPCFAAVRGDIVLCAANAAGEAIGHSPSYNDLRRTTETTGAEGVVRTRHDHYPRRCLWRQWFSRPRDRQPVGGHGSNCPCGGAVTLTLGVELICYHSLMRTVTYHRHRFPAEVTGVPLSDFGGALPHSRFSSILDLMRAKYRGTRMLAGGFDRDRAEAWLQEGSADIIAFGRKFLANPDLPRRLRDRRRRSMPMIRALITEAAQRATRTTRRLNRNWAKHPGLASTIAGGDPVSSSLFALSTPPRRFAPTTDPFDLLSSSVLLIIPLQQTGKARYRQ